MHRNNNFQALYWPLVIFGGSSLAFLTYLLMRQLFGDVVDALGPIFGIFGELFLWIYPALVLNLFIAYVKALLAELNHLPYGDTPLRAIASWTALFCLTWLGVPLSYYLFYYLMRDLVGLNGIVAGFMTFAVEGLVYKLSLNFAEGMKSRFISRR